MICLGAIGAYDQLEELISNWEAGQPMLCKDPWMITGLSGQISFMRGRIDYALDLLVKACDSAAETAPTLGLVDTKCLLGLLAMQGGRLEIARRQIGDIDTLVKSKSLPKVYESLRLELEALVEVSSGRHAAQRATQLAEATWAAFGSSSSSADWTCICIEVAVFARDTQMAVRFARIYARQLTPVAFNRALRLAEALGALAMMFGCTRAAQDFYALANSARQMVGIEIAPAHVHLRESVGAISIPLESDYEFEKLKLTDFSGKQFWSLTASIVRRFLNGGQIGNSVVQEMAHG
jgi:hypothetical protein